MNNTNNNNSCGKRSETQNADDADAMGTKKGKRVNGQMSRMSWLLMTFLCIASSLLMVSRVYSNYRNYSGIVTMTITVCVRG